MRRKLMLAALISSLLIPSGVSATVDTQCGNSPTTAVMGLVTDAYGSVANSAGLSVIAQLSGGRAGGATGTTGVNGMYSLCLPRHETYNVVIRDNRGFPLFAETSRPYTTFTNVADRLDFSLQSGFPVHYRQILTITPPAWNSTLGPATLTYTVRSKMPYPNTSYPFPAGDFGRRMELYLSHSGQTITMPQSPAEAGGPANGGWNVWTATQNFGVNFGDNRWLARAVGMTGASVRLTQFNEDYYWSDRFAPVYAGPGSPLPTTICGASSTGEAYSPATGTPNPQPSVRIGVCDPSPEGGSTTTKASGIVPATARGTLCPTNVPCDPVNTITNPSATPKQCVISTTCLRFRPAVGVNLFTWSPADAIPVGTWWLFFYVEDNAGNLGTNPSGLKLEIIPPVSGSGTAPVISGIFPSDLSSGGGGVVVGCSCTTPRSNPKVEFKVTDADGVLDVDSGSLRVRIYYGDERILRFDYDPTAPQNSTNYGTFSANPQNWSFSAAGFDLTLQPPGRYLVTASVMDNQGLSASIGWHFVFVGAAA